MKKKLLITTFCMLFSGLFNWHMLHANTAPLNAEVIELSVKAGKSLKHTAALKNVAELNLIKT